MLATAFDPLAAARDLKAAGFEPEQAEALAAQLRFAAGADHADLATKADVAALHDRIEALRATTKADIEALSAATKADVAALHDHIEALRATTKADIEALRATTKADVEALRAATKADFEALRAATKADVETLRAETKADIEALRADLYRALWIQGGAIVAILTALRFLPV